MRSDAGHTVLIRYQDEIVAIAGPRRFHLASHVEVRAPDDPLRLFVTMMCAFAGRIQEGVLGGPYTDARAEQYARCALIDDDEFAGAAGIADDDAAIAAHFNVPLEQIAVKRQELARRK